MCESWLVEEKEVEGRDGGVGERREEREGRRDEDHVRCVLMTLRLLIRDDIYQVRETRSLLAGLTSDFCNVVSNHRVYSEKKQFHWQLLERCMGYITTIDTEGFKGDDNTLIHSPLHIDKGNIRSCWAPIKSPVFSPTVVFR